MPAENGKLEALAARAREEITQAGTAQALAQVRAAYLGRKGSVSELLRGIGKLAPDERAREGVFLAFQYPVEIPGVTNSYFLKASVNAVRKHRGEEELDAIDFLELVREKMASVEMDEKFLNRAINVVCALPPAKQALASKQLRSRFVDYLLASRARSRSSSRSGR